MGQEGRPKELIYARIAHNASQRSILSSNLEKQQGIAAWHGIKKLCINPCAAMLNQNATFMEDRNTSYVQEVD